MLRFDCGFCISQPCLGKNYHLLVNTTKPQVRIQLLSQASLHRTGSREAESCIVSTWTFAIRSKKLSELTSCHFRHHGSSNDVLQLTSTSGSSLPRYASCTTHRHLYATSRRRRPGCESLIPVGAVEANFYAIKYIPEPQAGLFMGSHCAVQQEVQPLFCQNLRLPNRLERKKLEVVRGKEERNDRRLPEGHCRLYRSEKRRDGV
jgi:hypothetical protein